MENLKDKLSNYIGVIVVVGTAASEYINHLDGKPMNWLALGTAVALAVISYMTGKNNNLSK